MVTREIYRIDPDGEPDYDGEEEMDDPEEEDRIAWEASTLYW